MAKKRIQKTKAKHIHRSTNKVQAVELRLQGLGYREIAKQLGISLGHACRLVVEAIEDNNREAAHAVEKIKATELARTEGLLDQYYPTAVEGDAEAAKVVLRILERRAKYLGLDAPANVNANITGSVEVAAAFLPRERMRETILSRLAALGAHSTN